MTIISNFLSEYELFRLNNIEKNEAEMKRLGLITDNTHIIASKHRTYVKCKHNTRVMYGKLLDDNQFMFQPVQRLSNVQVCKAQRYFKNKSNPFAFCNVN